MWRVLSHADVPPLFRGGHHNPGIANLDRNVESRQHVAHESVRVGRVWTSSHKVPPPPPRVPPEGY